MSFSNTKSNNLRNIKPYLEDEAILKSPSTVSDIQQSKYVIAVIDSSMLDLVSMILMDDMFNG